MAGIKSVDVNLGDLTILVGPQASGKSLFLELFKLVIDKNSIVETLRKYNYILSKTDMVHPGLLFLERDCIRCFPMIQR